MGRAIARSISASSMRRNSSAASRDRYVSSPSMACTSMILEGLPTRRNSKSDPVRNGYAALMKLDRRLRGRFRIEERGHHVAGILFDRKRAEAGRKAQIRGLAKIGFE